MDETATGHKQSAARARVSLREKTKARNRAAIMSAAREVFLEMGYGAASVSDIVRKSGLSQGTFYNYFADKETVFVEIVEAAAYDLRGSLVAVRTAADNPLDFVRAGFRTVFESTLRDGTLAGILRRNYVELTSSDASVASSIPRGNVVHAMQDDLATELRDRIAAGQMPPFDVEYMVQSMTVVVIQLANLLVERDPPDVDGATEFATSLFAGYFMFANVAGASNDR